MVTFIVMIIIIIATPGFFFSSLFGLGGRNMLNENKRRKKEVERATLLPPFISPERDFTLPHFNYLFPEAESLET